MGTIFFLLVLIAIVAVFAIPLFFVAWFALGRWGILALSVAVPTLLWWHERQACARPGACDSPGDAFGIFLVGPLLMAWIVLALGSLILAWRFARADDHDRP